MSVGFYKRRRGILEHLETGAIDLLESGIHDYLSLKANLLIGSPSSIPVGICFTSAPAIHAHCKRVSERTIQRCLSHLEEIGWLKTFRSANQRGNYPALICRASIHDLAGNEYRINADATTDWRHPVYEAVGQVSPETSNAVLKVAGLREVENLEVIRDSKAVRRTANDAELHILQTPSFKRSRKKERLCAHLAAKIAKDGERLEDWDLGEWKEEIIQTFDAIGYKLNPRSPQLSAAFLITACEIVDENREREITRGNLCSKIIDRLVRENKEDPDGGYYWPPDFQEHRDSLRQAERAAEPKQLAAVGA